MNNGYGIRAVKRYDVPALLALLREMAEYERLLDRFTATEGELAAALFSPVPFLHGVIAEVDGGDAGFAIWTFSFHTFRCQRVLFVEDVFVREAKRGTGVGYGLFRHMAREAVAQGCARMDWHVLDWNALALRFYDRIGATEPPVSWVARQLTGDALAALASNVSP